MPPPRPVLGITMGDPAGVGPEITVKALARPDVAASCRAVVIGDRSVMAATLELLRAPPPPRGSPRPRHGCSPGRTPT